MSNGLLARSIGGGGGSGGNVIDVAFAIGEQAASVSVGLGGSGGAAGDGGAASVNSSGNVSTAGHRSYGIVAQSIGGGGGSGGNAHTYAIAASLGGGSSGRAASASVGIGGTGGNGGTGSTIDVTQSGQGTTTGDLSNGILLQSIGGGGNGGHAHSFDLSTSIPIDPSRYYAQKASLLNLIGKGTEGPQPDTNTRSGLAATVSVGGTGGSGNFGGGVNINLGPTTTINTAETQSHGVFAQSIGGGGGSGGYAYSDGFAGIDSYGVTLAIGGKGGTGGHGGAVNILTGAGSGSIRTNGDTATASSGNRPAAAAAKEARQLPSLTASLD